MSAFIAHIKYISAPLAASVIAINLRVYAMSSDAKLLSSYATHMSLLNISVLRANAFLVKIESTRTNFSKEKRDTEKKKVKKK